MLLRYWNTGDKSYHLYRCRFRHLGAFIAIYIYRSNSFGTIIAYYMYRFGNIGTIAALIEHD